MTVRINKQKINLREKLAGVEGKVNAHESYENVLNTLPGDTRGLSVGGPLVGQIKTSDGYTGEGLVEDIGVSWTKVEMGSGLESILSLAYCGNGIVIAGSGSSPGDGDIYRSTDYGASWTKVEMGSDLEYILSLAYCGNGIVIAGSGVSTGDGDVYRSTDYGVSWTKVEMGPGLEYIISLAYCGNGIVIAGSGGHADDGDIYRSTLLEQPNYFAGNVGIGTTNPGDKKLYVNGPIQSTSSINYKDMEIVLPGGLGVSRTLFVVEPDSHYMVTVTRGDTPSQLTTCMVTTASSIDGDAADVNIHEITNSGHYSIIYETSNKSIRWKNDTSSSPPKINASVLKLK